MGVDEWTSSALSWIRDASSSHRLHLIGTAVLSGSLVAAAILGSQAASHRKDVQKLKKSISSSTRGVVHEQIPDYQASLAALDASAEEEARYGKVAERARAGDYDEDLILEQLARNRVFLADAGLAKLRSSFVIIVGCGGVGSHTAAALARSGVSKIRLIDFDQVSLSSLNRHAVATLADVGTPKVDCLRKRLEQITPWVKFDCRNELFQKSAASRQLEPWEDQVPTFVVDAIDNIDSKVDLLKYCHDFSLPVVSSMGAGTKSDPTQVYIGDISASTDDPLSKSTRRRLRVLGVSSGIPVVFSTEKPGPEKAKLLPLPEDQFQKGDVKDLSVLPDFRVRILPVLGTMPAVFGLCVANHVILEITGYPHEYLNAKRRDKMYDAILGYLQGAEERYARQAGIDAVGLRVAVSQDDVGFLVDEIFRGRSVISSLPSRLTLARWRPVGDDQTLVDTRVPGQKQSNLQLPDLVCMTKDEAAKHEQLVLKPKRQPEDVYGPGVIQLVNKRQQELDACKSYR